MRQDERRFAFGDNTHSGHACPALSAGYSPESGGAVCSIAEEYDTVARSSEDRGEGTVFEEDAKEYWDKAIENVKSRKKYADDEEELEWLDTVAEAGEMVKEELF